MTSRGGSLFPDPVGVADCLVLRVWPSGETSLVVSLLSEGDGYLKAIAKGARAPHSRLRPLLQPGSLADLAYTRRPDRELQYLRGGQLLRPALDVTADLERAACLMAMVELVDRCRLEGGRTAALFGFCRDFREVLSSATDSGAALAGFYAFELRLLRLHGLSPEFTRCVGCGRGTAAATAPVFDIPQGGVVCRDCTDAAGGPERSRLTPRTRDLLVRLQDAGDRNVGPTPVPTRGVRREAGIVLHRFLAYHLAGYRLPAGLDLLRAPRRGGAPPEDASAC